MNQPQSLALSDDQLHILNQTLMEGISPEVIQMLGELSPADTAHLLASSPPKIRSLLWKLIEKNSEGDVLNEMNEEVRQFFIDQMDVPELINILEGQDIDDIADLLQQLPQTVIKQFLASMSLQDRQRIEEVLSWPENTAGGLMNTDTITIRSNISLDVVLRYLRRHEKLPECLDNLIVVDRSDHIIGLLPITELLINDSACTVDQIMIKDFLAVPADMLNNQVAQVFERENLVSAPIIDNNKKLLGRITVDDVIDVIRYEADHKVLLRDGLDDDEDTFAPIFRTAKRRAVWLGINLITTFISVSVIGFFQNSIDQVVALAVLMPLVASMGGVAGCQTLTLIIRGISLGQIGRSNAKWLLIREFCSGFANGTVWALVVSLAAWLWFHDPVLSLAIGLAMVINLCIAVSAGTLLPLILKSIKVDPALAGTVILFTITDVCGLLAFLGLATFFYS